MISAVALSPALDVTYVVSELHGIQRPLAVRRVGGGKSLNAARAAARLGADVLALAVLGGGTGQVVREAATADGVVVEAFDGGALTRTCISISSAATGELTEIYETAVPVAAETFDAVLERLADVARERPGWWLVSGSSPQSLGDDALTRVAATVRAAGARLAVDSHGRALAAVVRDAAPDLVKVNRAEAVELTGLPVDAPLTDLVDAVGRRTGGLVVVTDGTAGATAGDGRSRVHVRLEGHVGLFPVGSGDSFLGGLLVGLEETGSLGEALRLAAAAAAANAQVPGAAVLDPELAREWAARVALG
ncbi:1-phosphofructokinase family hexose kinase [Georgenia ruanii]|uniref:Carbohydrate kinase PfkB domain-containing protein n=1 Tax=Georgenia ruanii TaxID=348442 RepID=A0A7J9UT82_9MICO|nr:PfkB family carbohydrate kinase [Georgenia ruanii]MPV87826.1 hypothetical protein [Georgenia ruanii]